MKSHEFTFNSHNLNTLIRILGSIIISYLPSGSELAWIDIGFHPRPFSMEDILEIIRDATYMKVYYLYMKEVLNILPRCRKVRHNTYLYCDIAPPHPFPTDLIAKYIEVPRWKNNTYDVIHSFYCACVDGRMKDIEKYIVGREEWLITPEEIHCIIACAPEYLSLIDKHITCSMAGLGRWCLSNPDVKVSKEILRSIGIDYLSIYAYSYARYCHSELLARTMVREEVTIGNVNSIFPVAWRNKDIESLHMICDAHNRIILIVSSSALEEIDTSGMTILLLNKILGKCKIKIDSDTDPDVLNTEMGAIVTSILKTGIREQVYLLLIYCGSVDNLIRLSTLISSDKSTRMLSEYKELINIL